MRRIAANLVMPLVGVMAVATWADVIRLQDGQVIEGELKRNDRGWTVLLPDGGRIEVAAEQVQRVELKPSRGEGPRGEALALQRLESLRKSVESSGDLAWITGRYQEFLAQYTNTLAAEKAAADLERWRDRSEKGLVRLGDQWVTPDRRDELQIEATAQAAEARQLIKVGQTAKGRELLTQALRTDPQNVTALYLIALLDYEKDDLSKARKALETAQAQAKDHPATLNNLAVVAWRQKRTLDALALYDQAMAAAPEDERILQNVAEALHALPRDQQSAPIAQRAHRRFQGQDRKLQEEQEKLGRFRWGSQYVAKEEYDSLKAREQEIQRKLDGMATQFDDVEGALAAIDDQLASNEQTLRQIQANSYTRTWEGFLYRTPLPSIYYEILRENERLRRDRAGAVTELERLRTQARQIQQELPRPQFTGVQTPIGVEGTPLGAPLAAAKDAAALEVAEAEQQPEATVVIGPPRAPTTQPME